MGAAGAAGPAERLEMRARRVLVHVLGLRNVQPLQPLGGCSSCLFRVKQRAEVSTTTRLAGAESVDLCGAGAAGRLSMEAPFFPTRCYAFRRSG